MRDVVGTFCWLFVLSAIVAGCGEFRGIPSHGGGKRFDEEQRVVAGAIRQTLADMDLQELSGKRVQIVMECIAADGGGNVVFPGVHSVSAGINGNIGEGDVVQVIPSNGGGGQLRNDNSNNSFGGSTGLSYSPVTTYSASAMSSLPDVAYFRAALEMKARHVGLTLVAAEPEVVLYVLVDVLGTNRSQFNRFVVVSDQLAASCEATYYAQDPKTGGLLFEARRASSKSIYHETRYFGDKSAHISRQLNRTLPTRLPIDEPEKPTTRPITPMEVIVDTRDEGE
jgi:hypothetical protein